MLNRLEGRSGAWGLHRMDWDGAAALGRKALCWFALAGATFLLCRVHAAFAMAFLAAALLAGRNTAALLAGCVAGGMHGSLQSFDLRLPIGAAIVLGGSIAWEMLRPGEAPGPGEETRSGFGALPGRSGRRSSLRPAPSALARSPNRSEAAVCSALAGLGALIPGLACAGEAILPAAREKILAHRGPVIFTRDTHAPDYLSTQEGRMLPVEHCIRGTEGWQIRPELAALLTDAAIYEKPTFGSVRMAEDIRDMGDVEEIEMIGLCTDICVVSNALMLKAFLPEVRIRVDAPCCAGVTPEKHLAALETMRSCQIEIVEQTNAGV